MQHATQLTVEMDHPVRTPHSIDLLQVRQDGGQGHDGARGPGWFCQWRRGERRAAHLCEPRGDAPRAHFAGSLGVIGE